MAADVESSMPGDQTARTEADSDSSIVDALVDRWPLGPRTASAALRRHRAMSLPGIGLLALASPLCLVLGTLTLGQAWAEWDLNEVAPIIGYLLITIAIVAPFELARQIQRRRRAILVGQRLLEVGMAICPGCGANPFEPGGCCRRAPVGWSLLDLYGFWHEATVQTAELNVRPGRRAGNLGLDFGLSFVSRRDRLGDADFVRAWRRSRGPYGTSLSLPRANPAAKASRSIRRWWTLVSPLWFVLIAVVAVPPALSLSPGDLSAIGWIFFGIVVFGGLWGLVAFLRRMRDRSEAGLLTVPRCDACRYRLHPPFPDTCPECGVDILTAQDITLVPYRVD